MKLSQLNEALESLNEAEELRNEINVVDKRYSALSDCKNAIAKRLENIDLKDIKSLSFYQELLTAIIRLSKELSGIRDDSNKEIIDKKLKYIDYYINGIKKSIHNGKLMFESLDKSFSLIEAREYKDLDDDFNISNIDHEYAKRADALKYLKKSEHEVDEHYINRYRYDLFIIGKLLKEKIDFSDEELIKAFFDDIDFRIKHAKKYIGLPG